MESEAVKTLLARGGMTQQPIEHPAGGSVILVPQGYDVTHLEPRNVLLPFIQASPTFSEIESFVSYVNEYKGGASKIFADRVPGKLTAILDYHEKATVGRCAHSAYYIAVTADEWKPWEGIHEHPLNQVQFAEFLEEQASSVLEPDGATLLEIVTTLEAKTDVTFASKLKLSNGNQNLVYQENTDAKGAGTLPVPSELILRLPVYRGGAVYEIKAFLRCRIKDGKASFVVKIHELAKTKQFAFKQISDRAAQETQLEVLHGTARGDGLR